MIPGKLMAKEDRQNNGIVQASDQVYYTGALDTYLGDESFYNRLMLMTGRWESEEKRLEAYVDYAEVADSETFWKDRTIIASSADGGGMEASEANDYIKYLALSYAGEDGIWEQKNGFFYQGNSIRALCNLTEFEMMPRLFSPYYLSWSVTGADVYRYTDSYFGKYKCDMALIHFDNNNNGLPWVYGDFLVDVESGDYTGFQFFYQADENLPLLKEMQSEYREEGKEGEEWLDDWLALFIDGETVTLEDGSSVKTPLSETREEKVRLNENMAGFMNVIDFEGVEPVTDPARIQEIPGIPFFGKTIWYADGHSPSETITYAWSVTEKSTQKKFYFVISSSKESFQAYFSPMPEKTTENSLTDR